MANRDDIQILNDFSAPEGFRVRSRTSKRTGRVKRRISIEIEAQPVLFDLSEFRLGKGPAEAIRKAITDDFNALTEPAKLATRRFRERALLAFNRGERWALKRYSGGRTGPKPPAQSIRKFIDSGRLKDGLFVRENRTDESWTINAPANRLNPNTFDDADQFATMLRELREAIPSLTPDGLKRNRTFRRAVEQAVTEMIDVRRRMRQEGIARLRAAKLRFLATVGRIALT